MVLAGALGVLLTLTVLRSADHSQPVLVASHDLVRGAVIDDASVHVARLHGDPSVMATLFGAGQLEQLRGSVVTNSVRAGELVLRGSVSARDTHAAARVMSFSIPRSQAVGGKLGAGDRVDVVAVDHDSHQSDYVMTDAEIVAVDAKGGGALSGASDDETVTLVVDGVSAPRLASALDAGSVSLVRSTGAPPIDGQVADASRSGK